MKTIFICILCGFVTIQLTGQEIKSYNLNVNIDTKTKKLHVEGLIDIDYGSRDTISLVLWRNSNIQSINFSRTPLRFIFDTISPSPSIYIPDGRKLNVIRPGGSKEHQSVFFKYESDLSDLNGWSRVFSEDWIELNYYSAWFPLNIDSRNFTSKFNIFIDNDYKITGSGIVTRKNDHWEMVQPWSGFDNVLIASKSLKSKVIHKNNLYFETDYVDFPDADADSINNECKYVSDYYQNLFGTKDSTYLKFVVAPFETGGGYSRKNFICLRTKQFGLYTCMGIGHELAHFWWSNATTTSWEDWLNEAFAQYSMDIYLRERLGSSVFEKEIDDYKERAKNTPPIWGIDRNDSRAYSVLYEKGALILNELEQKMGKQQFIRLLKIAATAKVKTTNEFLDIMEMNFSKEIRQWMEQKLKTA
jgi:hypothetical protein